ncbi:phosphosulfolactate synthase, partial [Candidatus Woesearchaeota archaeon]|nr:phosphosulfolactate synthase [Candidatus Woesearchaeota archaeon]
MEKAWEEVFTTPVTGRFKKTRIFGLTMVIDKILSVEATKQLIKMAGEYIDIIKLTFGTSALYNYELLRQKNKIIRDSNIDVMPGGTFLEIAVWQDRLSAFLE